ncbi:MAG: ABC transporter permease [Betaproteobacteria bacterium]
MVSVPDGGGSITREEVLRVDGLRKRYSDIEVVRGLSFSKRDVGIRTLSGGMKRRLNALAPNYDFFTYFFTLVWTPMLLLSSVSFPVDQMPAWLAGIAAFLPLKHAIDLARPLMLGRVPDTNLLHVAVLLFYAALAYYVGLVLTRRRLLQ